MTRPLPKNLELLYQTFHPKRIGDILQGEAFEVDGVEFVSGYVPESTSERFYIVKTPELIERYRQVCAEFASGRVMELGIAEGGSTAFMALVARPEKLVAIDLEPEPLPALDEFIAQRGLQGTVVPLYGVDQADRSRLHSIVREHFGTGGIDLVVDDCSHMHDPTRASFEALFPFMRPGGLYLIEDWNNDHRMRDAVSASLREQLEAGDEDLRRQLRESLATEREPGQRHQPLTQIAIELMLARASSGDVVASVTVDDAWISVRRGPAEVDPETFALGGLYTDHFGLKGWASTGP